MNPLDPNDLTAHHPPVKDGYVRVYEDHTYRWFKDYTVEEYEKIMNDDPLVQILNEEVQKEVDAEIIRMICNKAKNE